MEGADGLSEGIGQGVDGGVVSGEEKEEGETGSVQDIPELEKPGGGGQAQNEEADKPGNDYGAEFIDVAGASGHVRVDIGVEDIEVVGRIKDGGGQETKEEV